MVIQSQILSVENLHVLMKIKLMIERLQKNCLQESLIKKLTYLIKNKLLKDNKFIYHQYHCKKVNELKDIIVIEKI